VKLGRYVFAGTRARLLVMGNGGADEKVDDMVQNRADNDIAMAISTSFSTSLLPPHPSHGDLHL
jgi:hypothetical protein